MSASREKKKRQAQYDAGELSKTPAKQSSFKPIYILYAAIAVLFVIVFIFVTMVNNGFFASRAAALTVGDHKVSSSMYSFFYRSTYANYYNTYSDYIENYSYPFSATESLDEQVYDSSTGETWAEYFHDLARDGMVWAYTLADEAEAAGYTLSSDASAEIDTIIDSLDATAASYSYNTANGYLAAYFGTGCTTKLYREFLELEYLASEYATIKEDSFTYTEDELLAYYEDNKADFDTVDYRTYFVDGEPETVTTTDEETGEEVTVDPTDEETEAAMSAALDIADAMATASKGDEDTFVGYAYLVENGLELGDGETWADYAGDDYSDATTKKTAASYSTASSTLDAMAEWLFNSDRVEGDTVNFSTDTGYYVVYFIGRNDNDYSTVNVRHILIQPEDVEDVTDEDGNVDEDATAAAEEAADEAAAEQAQALLDEFLAGDQTEDSFAELAEANSTDTGSNTNGGLYENVYQGQMVTAFNDWCFDPDRQVGDTGIVETSYGYHIMYFSGYGDNYRETLVEDTMRSDDYDAWYEEASAPYEITEHSFGMRFLNY